MCMEHLALSHHYCFGFCMLVGHGQSAPCKVTLKAAPQRTLFSALEARALRHDFHGPYEHLSKTITGILSLGPFLSLHTSISTPLCLQKAENIDEELSQEDKTQTKTPNNVRHSRRFKSSVQIQSPWVGEHSRRGGFGQDGIREPRGVLRGKVKGSGLASQEPRG
uniref:Uncharacterized protein n=1 Tax=Molossus molossus TaxID=27622 RepID=A0A7J8GKN4_MOLMO|nr:hypothetical protein HJG59_011440 [Molossus molossus]